VLTTGAQNPSEMVTGPTCNYSLSQNILSDLVVFPFWSNFGQIQKSNVALSSTMQASGLKSMDLALPAEMVEGVDRNFWKFC
jgi:hypothetical protein